MPSISEVETPYQEAVKEIIALTGLTRDEVSAILGVTRQTLHRWAKAKTIESDNRRRLLQVAEILKLAARKHPSREAFQAWLTRPRGDDGRSPATLLEAGEFDRVRLLAVTAAPTRTSESPTWLHNAPIDEWSERVERRRRTAMPESDNDPVMELLAEMDREDDLDGE